MQPRGLHLPAPQPARPPEGDAPSPAAPPGDDTRRSEPRGRVVRRRLVTVPRMLLAFALTSALLPLGLLAAAAVDTSRLLRGRHPPSALRLLGFGSFFLFMELVGITGLFLAWLGAGLDPARRRARLVESAAALQRFWAGALFGAVRRLFRLRFLVEGDERAAPGPLLVFIRHASIVDVLLPTVFITAHHGMRLRFVLKRELLADPCLDIAGNRLLNHFVSRGGQDSEAEIARVRALARGLGPHEGVLIYPEGTRFSPARRERALERLREGGHGALYERAQRLAHVLPPRLGGPLGLLDEAEGADVLFVAHHGLEGFTHLGDVWRGGLVGRTIRVRMWRVPAHALPRTREERILWLYDEWQRVDDFVAQCGA